MESALQHEVTSRAAVTAQHNTLQECVVTVLADLQQQYAGARRVPIKHMGLGVEATGLVHLRSMPAHGLRQARSTRV
jgi:hypothetical protein